MIPSRTGALLPDWVHAFLDQRPCRGLDPAERMRIAVDLSARNVEQRTGGPFGAAIFDSDRGDLVSVGVNLVVSRASSLAHAEIVAIAIAQDELETHDLGGPGLPSHEIVTSCEPCTMCLGAILWSGVRRVTAAARDEDARAIGFDEGPKPRDWAGELEKRGIAVTTDVAREEARAVLRGYAEAGGAIYGGRGGD